MNYEPSKLVRGVWVSTPLFNKKGDVTRVDTYTECVVPYDTPLFSWTSGKVTVSIKPIYVGWTRDAWKTTVSSDTLVDRRTMKTLAEVLNTYPPSVSPGLTGVA